MTLAHLSLRKVQDGDPESAARFRVAAGRLVDLHDEIRGNVRKGTFPEMHAGPKLLESVA